jgi:hypothetical protein
MSKLTKMINFNIDGKNSDLYSMNNNNTMIPLTYNSKSPCLNRKISFSTMNSPNTSSISSADSLTVAKKGKNSKNKPNNVERETNRKVSLM